MKYRDIFILLLGFLFYWCLRPAEVITGHWHLTRIDEHGGNSTFDTYYTLDIEKDSAVILGKYLGRYGGINGKMFDDGYLRIGPSCFGFSGEYKFKNGVLYLYEKRYGEEDAVWIGEKMNSDFCNKQKAFFFHEKIMIDLPISREGTVRKNRNLETPIFYGI